MGGAGRVEEGTAKGAKTRKTSPLRFELKLWAAFRARGEFGKLPVINWVRVNAAATSGSDAAASAATSSAFDSGTFRFFIVSRFK